LFLLYSFGFFKLVFLSYDSSFGVSATNAGDCHIGATATFEKSPRVVQGYKVNIAAAVEDHMEQEF
jgi:hypothetical protein